MDRDTLLNILNRVKPALAKRDWMPIFNHFIFNKDKQEVMANTDSIAIRSPIEVPFTAAVSGPHLLGLIDNSQGEVSFKEGTGAVTVEVGKTKLVLPTMAESSFVFDWPTPGKPLFKLALDDECKRAFRLCLITSETTAGFDTIFVDMGGGSADIYSTDNEAISHATLERGMQGGKNYLLQAEFVRLALQTAKDSPVAGDVLFYDDYVIANFPDYCEVYGAYADDERPQQFVRMIDSVAPKETVIIPNGFEDAIHRSCVIAEGREDCKLTIKGRDLHLLTESSLGRVEDNFQFDEGHPHPDMTFKTDPNFIKRVVEDCDELGIGEHSLMLRGAGYSCYVSEAD